MKSGGFLERRLTLNKITIFELLIICYRYLKQYTKQVEWKSTKKSFKK